MDACGSALAANKKGRQFFASVSEKAKLVLPTTRLSSPFVSNTSVWAVKNRMGCTSSTDKEDAEKNKNINKQLAEEKRRLENEVKLLLLGTFSFAFLPALVLTATLYHYRCR